MDNKDIIKDTKDFGDDQNIRDIKAAKNILDTRYIRGTKKSGMPRILGISRISVILRILNVAGIPRISGISSTLGILRNSVIQKISGKLRGIYHIRDIK